MRCIPHVLVCPGPHRRQWCTQREDNGERISSRLVSSLTWLLEIVVFPTISAALHRPLQILYILTVFLPVAILLLSQPLLHSPSSFLSYPARLGTRWETASRQCQRGGSVGEVHAAYTPAYSELDQTDKQESQQQVKPQEKTGYICANIFIMSVLGCDASHHTHQLSSPFSLTIFERERLWVTPTASATWHKCDVCLPAGRGMMP